MQDFSSFVFSAAVLIMTATVLIIALYDLVLVAYDRTGALIQHTMAPIVLIGGIHNLLILINQSLLLVLIGIVVAELLRLTHVPNRTWLDFLKIIV